MIGSLSAKTAKYISLVLAAIISILPIVVVVIASFKSASEYAQTGPFDLPAHLNFANYLTAFTDGKMLQGFFNTMLILVISLAGTIMIGTMAAYALDRFSFAGNKLVMGLFLMATLVPSVTTQVATFRIINHLNLFNTLGAPIVLFMGTDIISIYIFLQFMASIPKALDEAAMLDGANRWTIFTRIILPNLRPAIVTVIIIRGIAIYNEFYTPFLYMPSAKLGVISTSLFRFKGPFGAHWEVISAGTIIVIIPTLVAFIFLQRYIYAGMTAGATK